MFHSYSLHQCIDPRKTNSSYTSQKSCLFIKTIEQLQNSILQKRIAEFQSRIEKEICSNLPNAFWKRKQLVIDLSYDDNFNKKQIPTRTTPIQMNAELEQHCHIEIKDLEFKGLI